MSTNAQQFAAFLSLGERNPLFAPIVEGVLSRQMAAVLAPPHVKMKPTDLPKKPFVALVYDNLEEANGPNTFDKQALKVMLRKSLIFGPRSNGLTVDEVDLAVKSAMGGDSSVFVFTRQPRLLSWVRFYAESNTKAALTMHENESLAETAGDLVTRFFHRQGASACHLSPNGEFRIYHPETKS